MCVCVCVCVFYQTKKNVILYADEKGSIYLKLVLKYLPIFIDRGIITKVYRLYKVFDGVVLTQRYYFLVHEARESVKWVF